MPCAAARGMIFRDAAALEGVARVSTIAFDKTGTLTEGRPEVSSLVPVEGCSFARARLGQRRGQLAIRIEQLEAKPEETR